MQPTVKACSRYIKRVRRRGTYREVRRLGRVHREANRVRDDSSNHKLAVRDESRHDGQTRCVGARPACTRGSESQPTQIHVLVHE